MNGIIKVIISMSKYSKLSVPQLCHETECKAGANKQIQCKNCPLCSTKWTSPNVIKFYGDKDD